METGRIETVYNQQRLHNVDNQHGVIQDEWQTQKRRNGNQQTRGDTDRNSQRNEDRQGHQQQIQPGMVSVITKNTYIDLDVQDIGQSDEEGEEHIVQTHDQR